MRVLIRGVEYPSVPAAAKALKVSINTVYSAVARGKPETCGLGRGNRTLTRGGQPKKPIHIGPYHFESVAELARFIGRPVRSVRVSIRRGELARSRVALAVARIEAKQADAYRKAYESLNQPS